MRRLVWVVLCCPLLAQQGESLLSRADFIQNWKTSKEFTLAVADEMPEKFYRFKPNPAEMNFATLMVHIADSNRFRFAQVSEDKTACAADPQRGEQGGNYRTFAGLVRLLHLQAGYYHR